MYEPYGFSGLAGQNRADTQAADETPTMPGYTGLDRLAFADMRTPEDQIHWLYLKIIGYAADVVTPDELQSALAEAEATLRGYIDAQDSALAADVQAKYLHLIDLIGRIGEFSGSVYDPTQGVAWAVDEVLEHVYDFDRAFALTAADYDSMHLGAGAYDALGTDARWYDVAGAVCMWDKRAASRSGSAVSFGFLDKLVNKLTGQGADPVNAIAPRTVATSPFAAEGAVAIGDNATAQGDDSVALGRGSDASEPNTVSVSGSGIERRIVGVAPPVNDRDAANKKYVDEHQQDLSGIEGRLDGLDSDVAGLQTADSLMTTRIAEVEASEAQTVKDVAALKGDVAQNKSDIAEAKTELATDGDNIEQLQADVEELKARPAGTVVNSIAPLTVSPAPLGGAESFACGAGAKAQKSGVAVGHLASAYEEWETVAVGLEANTGSNYRAIAIGSRSKATRSYEFSVGDAATSLKRKIGNVDDPELAQDAATKNYVDTAIAGVNAKIDQINAAWEAKY